MGLWVHKRPRDRSYQTSISNAYTSDSSEPGRQAGGAAGALSLPAVAMAGGSGVYVGWSAVRTSMRGQKLLLRSQWSLTAFEITSSLVEFFDLTVQRPSADRY